MPIYEFICPVCASKTEQLMKIDEAEKALYCQSRLDCGGRLEREYQMHNKPLVADRDLFIARTHNGKKSYIPNKL